MKKHAGGSIGGNAKVEESTRGEDVKMLDNKFEVGRQVSLLFFPSYNMASCFAFVTVSFYLVGLLWIWVASGHSLCFALISDRVPRKREGYCDVNDRVGRLL
jgi:hypothetical protein